LCGQPGGHARAPLTRSSYTYTWNTMGNFNWTARSCSDVWGCGSWQWAIHSIVFGP
jgi:hypothetical protein